ncbi:hypothetical protein FIV46_04575 [Emcibacter nanhaiensis]|uniref:Uncharacterized protein n=1 Tax=Emcibacter nanhaiensis TaxID=1505037 RepID=A0A501PP65_9PROT|nr:hypothetical protein FIV46_04575 [Emcibacter nanhaiensis]
MDSLTDRLCAECLPRAEWTHEGHLAAGYCLLNRHGLEKCLIDMPGIIRRHNTSVGTPNSDSDGYHETITLFYLKAISHFIEQPAPDTDYVDNLNRLILGPYGDKDFPLRYYSEELLFSVPARYGWVEPDLGPLEFPGLG